MASIDTVSRRGVVDLEEVVDELSARVAALCRERDELAIACVEADAERRYYRELFDLAPQAFLVTDVSGMVLAVNHATTRILRRGRPEVVGRPLTAFVPLADRPAFRDRLVEVVRARSGRGWRFRVGHEDREPVVVEADVQLGFDSNGVATDLRWVVRAVDDPDA